MAFWRIFANVAAIVLMGLSSVLSSAAAATWTLVREDAARDIRVYTRDLPHSPFHEIYAITRVEGSVAGLERLFLDVAAMPQWVARLKRVQRLSAHSSGLVWHATYELPYPFKPRDVVLRSTRQERQGVVNWMTRSIPARVPVAPETIRMAQASNRWRLTPEGQTRVRVELWGALDPGGRVPALAYNYNVPDDALQTMRQLRRMSLRPQYQGVINQ